MPDLLTLADAPPRCGDHVLHRPSGETWLVAWAELADIRADDEREVLAFAHRWPSRFGRFTPHVNAHATIMRYDERTLHLAQRRAGPAHG